jgi:hypothetical protein
LAFVFEGNCAEVETFKTSLRGLTGCGKTSNSERRPTLSG